MSNIKEKGIWIIILLSSIMMVFDSIVVSVYYNTSDPGTSINLLTYFTLVISYYVINFFLLRYSKSKVITTKKSDLTLQFFRWGLILNQIVLCILITLPAVQLLLMKRYSLIGLELATYMSHLFALASLTLLAFRFVNWFKSNHNFVILIYSCTFCLFICALITSLIFLNIKFSIYVPDVRLKSISIAIADSPSLGSSVRSLISIYDYFSFFSFCCAWVATVFLLKNYMTKLGRISYFIIVTIPLAYFLFPFISDEFRMFDDLRLKYGRQFNAIYAIIFSPYKQVGALLFGMVFLTTATKIKRPQLKLLVMISGVGMTLMYGSSVTHGIKYFVTPPFGIITLSFLGLGSYLLLLGIFVTSQELARDNAVRAEINRSVGKQFYLFRTLSFAEVERILEKSVKPVIEKSLALEDNHYENDGIEEDYKDMIKEAIRELDSAKHDGNSSEKNKEDK